jgi:hypothetical protein
MFIRYLKVCVFLFSRFGPHFTRQRDQDGKPVRCLLSVPGEIFRRHKNEAQQSQM